MTIMFYPVTITVEFDVRIHNKYSETVRVNRSPLLAVSLSLSLVENDVFRVYSLMIFFSLSVVIFA